MLSLSLHEREDALIGEVLSSSTETKTRIARQIPKEPIESGMVPPSKQEVMDKIIQEAIPWLVAGLTFVDPLVPMLNLKQPSRPSSA